jgi:hypothetical protein
MGWGGAGGVMVSTRRRGGAEAGGDWATTGGDWGRLGATGGDWGRLGDDWGNDWGDDWGDDLSGGIGAWISTRLRGLLLMRL